MSEGLQIELSQDAKDIIARLGATDWLLRAVAVELNRQNQFTVDAIAEQRLTGKGPFPVSEHRLGERTHRLRPSLRRTQAEVSGSSVTGSIGTNVVYAAAHEFGVEEDVTVRPHARKQFKMQTFGALFGARKVRRKVRQADRFVGTFKRRLKLPARAPITTGVEERMPATGAAVSAAIVAAWRASA